MFEKATMGPGGVCKRKIRTMGLARSCMGSRNRTKYQRTGEGPIPGAEYKRKRKTSDRTFPLRQRLGGRRESRTSTGKSRSRTYATEISSLCTTGAKSEKWKPSLICGLIIRRKGNKTIRKGEETEEAVGQIYGGAPLSWPKGEKDFRQNVAEGGDRAEKKGAHLSSG